MTGATKKVKVLAFDGCEEVELFGVIDVLTRCGIEADIVAPDERDFVTTRSGVRVDCQEYAQFGHIGLDEADAIFIPGGQIESDFNKFAQEHGVALIEQIDELLERGGIVAAICIAPALLASIGAFDSVDDYKIVSYPGTQEGRYGKEHSAFELGSDHKPLVHAQKNIITGNGPGASIAFGAKFAEELLGSRAVVDEVLRGMLFD